jgi:hypothetical protein
VIALPIAPLRPPGADLQLFNAIKQPRFFSRARDILSFAAFPVIVCGNCRPLDRSTPQCRVAEMRPLRLCRTLLHR